MRPGAGPGIPVMATAEELGDGGAAPVPPVPITPAVSFGEGRRPESRTQVQMAEFDGPPTVARNGALGLPTRRPYHATAAFAAGLWASYSQTWRPPQQKPVMPRRPVSPPFALAQATLASRSPITCASGTLLTTSDSSLPISP